MAYKRISELAAASTDFLDTYLVEGQTPDGVESKKFTGAELRAVEKEERELADDTIATAVGLDANLNFIPFSGTEYLDAATTIAEAIEELDAGVRRDAMLKSVYDPREQEADCFDMDNMNDGTVHKILTVNAQNIDGEKTFLDQPKFAGTPALPEDLVNLAFITDDLESLGYMKKDIYDPTDVGGDVFDMDNMAEGSVNKILTNGNQDIKGKKSFESFPTVPDANPTQDKEVANKKYVDYVFAAAKREAESQLSVSTGTSGSLPSVNNANNIIEIQLTDVETPSSVYLGSHAAMKMWNGTAAEYAAISVKDANTLYYIYE